VQLLHLSVLVPQRGRHVTEGVEMLTEPRSKLVLVVPCQSALAS
jgi:hypothetical protein